MTVEPLRYPIAQIDKDTDFLEIKVVKYEAPGFNPGSFQQTTSSDSLAKNIEGPEDNNFRQPTSSDTLAANIETPIATIFLPIPENIQDSNAVNWGDDSLNGLAARAIGSAAGFIGNNGSFIDAVKRGGIEAAAFAGDVMNIPGTIRNSFIAAKAVGAFTNVNAQGVITRQTGQVLNPNMELLFNNVTLRSFNFQFDLAPRNKNESRVIKNIIRTLF